MARLVGYPVTKNLSAPKLTSSIRFVGFVSVPVFSNHPLPPFSLQQPPQHDNTHLQADKGREPLLHRFGHDSVMWVTINGG